MRTERRVDALVASVAKEAALQRLALAPGQFVTTWHGARAGLVVKVSKVSVKVRMIGGGGAGTAVVEKNPGPRYVQPAPASLPAAAEPGAEVVLRDHGGHIRRARVVEAAGPLSGAACSPKSGQSRSSWSGLIAIGAPAADSA